MESIVNIGPNMASFFLASGSRRWYVVGAYLRPHDSPAIYHTENSLEAAPKGMEFIMLGDLNARPRELRDNREDELASTLAGSGLDNVTSHFTLRRQYQGTGSWTCQMRGEGRLVERRGNYILRSYRDIFVKAGVREARLHTDHWMVLAVLRGEGALKICRYIVGRTRWPLAAPTVQPQTEWGGQRSRPLKGRWIESSTQKRGGQHGYTRRHVGWRIGGQRYSRQGEQAQERFVRHDAIFSACYRRTYNRGCKQQGQT